MMVCEWVVVRECAGGRVCALGDDSRYGCRFRCRKCECRPCTEYIFQNNPNSLIKIFCRISVLSVRRSVSQSKLPPIQVGFRSLRSTSPLCVFIFRLDWIRPSIFLDNGHHQFERVSVYASPFVTHFPNLNNQMWISWVRLGVITCRKKNKGAQCIQLWLLRPARWVTRLSLSSKRMETIIENILGFPKHFHSYFFPSD